jgi:PAS domain S-box-containing protein
MVLGSFLAFPSNRVGTLKASGMLREKSRGATFPFDGPYQSPLGRVGLTVAIGIAYFMAAELGLALRTNTGTSVFWPAAGISVGALIVWGPKARLSVAAAVVVATAISNLTIGRNPWLAVAFGVVNAGQALLTTGLIERWFGRSFKLGDVPQVLGFLMASAIGASVAAMGAAIAVGLIQSTASPFIVWRFWFASCLLGIVTVAPLLVGIGEAVRQLPPRRELFDGVVGILMLAALSAFVISLPQGPWSTALPVALVFPVLLWVIVRCRPVFAATAAFVVALAIVWSITFSVGHFGDASVPLADRILAAQTIVLAGALLTLVLAALFAERRRSELVIERSRQRLQLALDGAELGAFSADLTTGCFECDARVAQMHGHKVQPTTIRESRRFVPPHDRIRIDAALAEAERTGGVWNAEYRVAHPEGHRHAGEIRWVAVEGSIVRDPEGTALGLLGVTRDITDRKQTERALAERNLQMLLAGKSARVGSYTYDVGSDLMQVSEGYVAVHGLPDGTNETTRSEWRARTLPEDLPRVEAVREQAFRERLGEYAIEYRIVRSNGEVRWIESRSFISYDGEGRPERVVGVNFDITERIKATQVAQRLASIVESSDDAIVSKDLNGVVVTWNQSAERLFGYSADEAIGKPILFLLPTDRQHEELSILERIRSGKPINNYETVRRHKNGALVDISLTVSPLRNTAGVVVGASKIARDISDRKKAEAVLAERTMQLAIAGRAALVGSFAYDVDTERLQLSPGYAAIHGFPDGTTEIARTEWLAGVHPEDRERWEALRSRAHREQWSEYSGEYRIVRSGGEIRWIEARVFLSYASDGRPQRAVGVDIDVTARKRADEQQRTLNAELDHRVKNVLATVCAIITQTPKAGSSLADFVAGLDGRIKSLARTHELLSENQWQDVSLIDIVQREIAPYAAGNATILGPGVTLKAEAAQALATVLHELATNAAKYGAFSKPSGQLFVRWCWLRNGNGSHGWVAIQWQESGGPAVSTPSQFGYGTSIVRELIPFELGGTVDLAFASDGLQCRLEIPSEWITGTETLKTHLAGGSSQTALWN